MNRKKNSAVADLTALELHVPEIAVGVADSAPLINLLSGMKKLKALYLTMNLIDTAVLEMIIGICEELEVFHFVPEKHATFMMLNVLSKRLMQPGYHPYYIRIPSSITNVDYLVTDNFDCNVTDIDIVSDLIAQFMDYADLNVASASMILPSNYYKGSQLRDSSIYDMIDQFLEKNKPNWSVLERLKVVRLVLKNSFVLEVPRPEKVADADQQDRPEIQMTIYDFTYFLEKLCEFWRYRVSITFAPALKHLSYDAFKALLRSRVLHALNFEQPELFKIFLKAVDELDLDDDIFPNLDRLSGTIDAKDMSMIPFEKLNKIGRPRLIYVKVISNDQPRLDLSQTVGYVLDADASQCRQAFGEQEPSEEKEFCFYRVNAMDE